MASGALANLDIKLSADIADLDAKFKSASDIADKEMAKIIKAVANTGQQSDATRAALDKLTKSLAAPSDAGFKTVTKAADESAKAMEHVGFQSAGAKRELLVIAHELSQGNFTRAAGSVMVLGERINIMTLLFSAGGAAVLGFGAVLAGVLYEVYQGHEAWTKMNDALKSTNNYVGLTTSQMSDLALHMVGTTTDINATKEALTLLAATGRVSGSQLAAFGSVAVKMAKDSGAGIEDVVKSLATMSDGARKWAEDYNKQHHFMTQAQAEMIISLDKEGQQAKAVIEVLKALEDAHTRMYEKTRDQMGVIERFYTDWLDGVHRIKAAIASIGAPDTNPEKINAALKLRDDYERQLAFAEKYHDEERKKQIIGWLADNQKVINGLRDQEDAAKKTAKANADIAKGGDNAVAVNNYLEGGTHSRAAQLEIDKQKENKAFQETIANLDKNSKEYEAVKKHHLENLRTLDENYQRGGPKDDPSAVNLAASLKAQDALIAQEHKSMLAREEFLKRSLAEEAINLRQFYEQKRQIVADDYAATQASYAKEAADVIARKASLNPATDKIKIAEAEKQLIEIEGKRALAAQESARQMLLADGEQLKIQGDFNRATDEWVRKEGLTNAQQQFAIDLMGRSAVETAQLTNARKIYLDVEERIRQQLKKDPNSDVSGLQAAAKKQVDDSNALIVAASEKQRDGWFGASEAMRKYGDAATNAGAQIENAMANAFKGAEDALANFMMTGKINFSSMITSIESDLMHLASKSILNSIFGTGAGMSSGGSMFGSLIGSMFGAGGVAGMGLAQGFGSFATMNAGMAASQGLSIADIAGAFADGGDPPVGKASIVGEVGPEVFVPKSAGTIIPNDFLRRGADPAQQQPSVINQYITVPQSTSRSTAEQVGSVSGSYVSRALRRNG